MLCVSRFEFGQINVFHEFQCSLLSILKICSDEWNCRMIVVKRNEKKNPIRQTLRSIAEMSSNDNEMNYRCSIYRLLPRDICTNTSDQTKISERARGKNPYGNVIASWAIASLSCSIHLTKLKHIVKALRNKTNKFNEIRLICLLARLRRFAISTINYIDSWSTGTAVAVAAKTLNQFFVRTNRALNNHMIPHGKVYGQSRWLSHWIVSSHILNVK